MLSLGRLFDDASFLAPLILITLVGHSATAILRHRGRPRPVVAVIAAVRRR